MYEACTICNSYTPLLELLHSCYTPVLRLCVDLLDEEVGAGSVISEELEVGDGGAAIAV